jgi:hypothetical protein
MAATLRIRNGARPGSNPHLVIVNGGRRKGAHMAATKTKRRSTARARPTKRASNRRYSKPRAHNTRRRTGMRAVAHHRRRHTAARATNHRRRSHNPVVRHTRRRRSRNPFGLGNVTGIFEGGLTALIGMVLTDTLFGLASSAFAAYIASPLIGILVKLAIAWGVGEGARKFGFQKHANLLAIGGAVSAGKDAMNYFVGGGGLLFPQPTVQVQTAPGQALIPASATGDSMSDLTWAPAYMGDITYGPGAAYYYG